MAVAGLLTFVLRPVYEIDAIIQPGKFFVENQEGNITQVVVEAPQQVVDKVRHKSYDAVIAQELGMDEMELPDMEGEGIRNTLLARIWIRNHDVTQSKKILESLIALVKKDVDSKIDVEINNVDSAVRAKEIEKENRSQEIEILKKKLGIIEQRKKDILKEMESVKQKIAEIEKQQSEALKKEKRSESETLGMLLYANEIQQSFQYYDLLNEKLSKEKLSEEDVHSDIQDQIAAINSLENTIQNLKERKGRIDYTKVVKQPTSSLDPVFPKKKLVVALAGIFGLIVFTVAAFVWDYVRKAGRE
jgi:LPS O-antigen subunit length determinant protein (WzzB/FepE family)